MMTLMRSYNRQGAAHRDGLRFGRKVGQPVEDGGLVEYFFGKDGNEHLHYDKFSSFLKQLHDEVICFFPSLYFIMILDNFLFITYNLSHLMKKKTSQCCVSINSILWFASGFSSEL